MFAHIVDAPLVFGRRPETKVTAPSVLHTGKVTALRGGDTLDPGEGFVVTVQGRH